jgi:hypothetical protein
MSILEELQDPAPVRMLAEQRALTSAVHGSRSSFSLLSAAMAQKLHATIGIPVSIRFAARSVQRTSAKSTGIERARANRCAGSFFFPPHLLQRWAFRLKTPSA